MTLADQLLARRTNLLAVLRDDLNPAHLAMLAAADAVLRLLDAPPADALPGERAALSDDGHRIVLTVYADAERVAAVEIAPHRALGLASELLDAARRHIAAAGYTGSTASVA